MLRNEVPMMDGIWRQFKGTLFWGLSAGLPVQALLHLYKPPDTAPGRAPGCQILSLPAGLVPCGDPQEGWSPLWKVAVNERLVEETENSLPPGPEPEPIERSCPVEFFGEVGGRGSVVYCFLDTRDLRWFRLSPGSTDATASIRLDPSLSGCDPCLFDLQTGRRYFLRTGEPIITEQEEGDRDPVQD